jgi:uncharacterized OsmC-like protein
VKLLITVVTSQSEESLAAVIEETEARCPVMNLLIDAGVTVDVRWQLKPGLPVEVNA